MTSETGKSTGVTFIELLFVIIILGIIISAALPSFRKTFNSLALSNFARELQAFINYLSQRSVVEGEPIYLTIDEDGREYWARLKESEDRLRSYHIPKDIEIQMETPQISFYPDGTIDEATIIVASPEGENITITTKGVFGGAKLATEE